MLESDRAGCTDLLVQCPQCNSRHSKEPRRVEQFITTASVSMANLLFADSDAEHVAVQTQRLFSQSPTLRAHLLQTGVSGRLAVSLTVNRSPTHTIALLKCAALLLHPSLRQIWTRTSVADMNQHLLLFVSSPAVLVRTLAGQLIQILDRLAATHPERTAASICD